MRILILLMMLIAMPILAHAECNCYDDTEAEVSEFHPYNYIGVMNGTAHTASQLTLTGATASAGAYAGVSYIKDLDFEIAYFETGTFSTATGTITANASSISGIQRFSLGPISFLTKLGLAQTMTQTTTGAFGSSEFMLNVIYGAGLEVKLNRNLNFRVMFDRYNLKLNGSQVTNDFTYAGVAFHY